MTESIDTSALRALATQIDAEIPSWETAHPDDVRMVRDMEVERDTIRDAATEIDQLREERRRWKSLHDTLQERSEKILEMVQAAQHAFLTYDDHEVAKFLTEALQALDGQRVDHLGNS